SGSDPPHPGGRRARPGRRTGGSAPLLMAIDVLAVGAHPDDVEIGMGGSIASFLADGLSVAMLDLTNGEPTPVGSPEIRARESRAAANVLGVTTRLTLEFPNRYLQDGIEVRQRVAEVYRELRPRRLFVPYWTDAHPDHVAACAITEAARFYAKFTKTDMRGDPYYPPRLFHYCAIHLRLHVKPTFILDVSPHLSRKLEALGRYQSQFRDPRILQRIETDARYWGSLIGTEAGEPFVCREELGLASLGSVL
ncbi:MAG: bacillithiol biosynthesis deacetylase BshB1, partial [Candidatus Xenobia bacterium]